MSTLARDGAGRRSAQALALLCAVYAAVLAIGLARLPSPQHPIQDPWFTAMELLILAIAPVLVTFAAALAAAAAPAQRVPALLALVFFALCAGLTCVVHFLVLVLARHPAFAAFPSAEGAARLFAFTWPSILYALDILAWDFFFALGALAAALAVDVHDPQGVQDVPAARRRWARRLMLASAALAFAGLAGVPLADMAVRNIGIVGYVLVFPLAAWLLAYAPPARAHAPG